MPAGAPGSVASVPRTNRHLLGVETADLVAELLSRLRSREWDVRRLKTRELKELGQLATDLSTRVHDVAPNRCSPAKSLALLRKLRQHPDFTPEWLVGKTCVDVGCGGVSPLGALFGLLMAGAERGIGVDMDELVDPRVAARALYDARAAVISGASGPALQLSVEDVLARTKSFDFSKLALGDPAGIDRSRLDFVRGAFEACGFDESSVDLICSQSFLEHPPEPEALVAEMGRISRPGALGVHAIDGADHRVYRDASVHPLHFLEFPADRPDDCCNRVRPLDFVDLFERHGFEVREVVHVTTVEIDEQLRSRFAEPYRSMDLERLSCVRAKLFVRRR